MRYLLLLLLLTLPAVAQTEWNRSNPGQRFELKDYVRSEGLQVVVFRSKNCSACDDFGSKVSGLSGEVKINFLDVDRADSQDVDWKSPLSRQYNLQYLPYVILFDGKEEIARGYKARKLLLKRLDSANRS